MNFVEELRYREMLHDFTPGLEEHLSSSPGSLGYIGFDPTAPSLTIGNYVQIMLLTLFQKHGHRPVVVMGGATGRIGDPSGKDAERVLKSYDELDANIDRQLQQFKQFLNFDDKDGAILFNNLDIYKDMSALDFLRDVGKTITVSYMMSKDSVKNRLQTGLSFTEFSYQLLQGYDFQYLYENMDCAVQMGGSDQWGNITSGTEFIRRNTDGKAYAITTPLLTKADGSKFGKSAEGNIWLDPNMTSPYKFYQFWINSDDRDLPKFIKYFSLKSKDEIDHMVSEVASNPKAVSKLLAEELTERIHGLDSARSVENVSNILFNHKLDYDFLTGIQDGDWLSLKQEMTTVSIARDIENMDLQSLLVGEDKVFTSNGDFRRAIKNNALAVNKTKVKDHSEKLSVEDFFGGKYALVENGKKNKFLLVKES